MNEIERNSDVERSDALARRQWSTPTVRRMRAGDAENAYTQTRDDGIYTKS
jgi:hypothetical protein